MACEPPCAALPVSRPSSAAPLVLLFAFATLCMCVYIHCASGDSGCVYMHCSPLCRAPARCAQQCRPRRHHHRHHHEDAAASPAVAASSSHWRLSGEEVNSIADPVTSHVLGFLGRRQQQQQQQQQQQRTVGSGTLEAALNPLSSAGVVVAGAEAGAGAGVAADDPSLQLVFGLKLVAGAGDEVEEASRGQQALQAGAPAAVVPLGVV